MTFVVPSKNERRARRGLRDARFRRSQQVKGITITYHPITWRMNPRADISRDLKY
jgi:hypothetical protein